MKIGLEIHLQLPTRSKLFCSCPTNGEGPNTSVCPTCLGLPGSRPVLNRRALELGIMIAKFLNCKINEKIWFSRKTYFYPDLPKHFQITQYESPVGTDGHYMLDDRRIGIWRVHIEEDPGRIKRVGRPGEEVSLIDYNRSGIPLVEIVTAPDIDGPAQAREFIDRLVAELKDLIDITVQDETSVRVDANISVGEERVEVKNVQGLKNLERALRYEATRQTKVLEAGKHVVRETRRYDEERKITLPAREKEFEEDYGYIGEPDLGEYVIGPIARELRLKETTNMRAERLSNALDIPMQTARQVVVTSRELADLLELLCTIVPKEKAISWTLGPISSNWSALAPLVEADNGRGLIEIIRAEAEGRITDSEARMRIQTLTGANAGKEETCSGETDMALMVKEFLDAHPEVVKDYRSNPRAVNSVIGFVMKGTKGRYSSKDIVECVNKEMAKRV
ncbi:MAG: Asp-tRNA(Asn)/Glu-tRNA(Gln) amidotransferase subunit GatB [Methanomassiliicoccales archaeon]|nr:MAG: Asp-tRNA(Asn)/Glu-tRNA(Gln) amidotransferase subunit GatB [Methanomassiliicoccales archaeon]